MRTFLSTIVILFWLTSAFATPPPPENYCLIITSNQTLEAMRSTRDFIVSQGGTVALMTGTEVMTAWLPQSVSSAILGQHNIEQIEYQPVSVSSLSLTEEKSLSLVEYFNYSKPETSYLPLTVNDDYGTRDVSEVCGGVFESEIDPDDYYQSLLNAGFDFGDSTGPGAVPFGNDEFENSDFPNVLRNKRMIGVIAASLLFVESDGSIDQSPTTSWTGAFYQEVLNDALDGMTWLSNQAASEGKELTFHYTHWPPVDVLMMQGYEPSLHDSFDQNWHVSDETKAWVSAVMCNLGYDDESLHIWSRIAAYNTMRRSAINGDGSFSSFLVYNPWSGNPPGMYPVSLISFAQGSAGATVVYCDPFDPDPGVHPHEIAHTFYACDEYSISPWCAEGCAYKCGPLYDIENANCVHCDDYTNCLMKTAVFALCDHTKDQLGWDERPDLWLQNVEITSVAPYLPGDNHLSVEVTVVNCGETNSDMPVGIYFFLDANIAPDLPDWELLYASQIIPPLNVGEMFTHIETNIQIPPNLPEGTYFLYCWVDPFVVAHPEYVNDFYEYDEDNNRGAYPNPIFIGIPQVDFVFESVGISSYQNNQIALHSVVRNIGQLDSPSTIQIGYYLEQNNTQYFLGDDDCSILEVGESEYNYSGALTIPSSLPPEDYQVIFVADYLENVNEGNEENNITDAGEIPVNGGSPFEEADKPTRAPFNFHLDQNVPNPFFTKTAIRYSIPHDQSITLQVFNLAGQIVKTLENRWVNAGNYQSYWNGTGDDGQRVSSGIYFCRLTLQDGSVETRQMLLIR